MIVHFINYQKEGKYIFYDILLIENNEVIFRLPNTFSIGITDVDLENRAIELVNNLSPDSLLENIIIDKIN